MRLVTLTLALFLPAITTGCAEQPKSQPGQEQRALSFLQDGRATLEEVVLRLGVPTDHFEQDRILTYRVAFKPAGDLQLMSRDVSRETGTREWESGQFSLVLVFNEQLILVRHSLVPLHTMGGA